MKLSIHAYETPAQTQNVDSTKFDTETKLGAIVRPRRKTINLGKNLGPPKRVKINEELIQKEKDVLSIILESKPLNATPEPEINDILEAKPLNATPESEINNTNLNKEDAKPDTNDTNINKEDAKPEPDTNDTNINKEDVKLEPYTNDTNTNKDIILLNGKAYTRTKCIGRGGSSRVYKVIDSNSQVFALKRVLTSNVDENTIKGYINEVELLQKLAGRDRIIKLYDHEINTDKGYILMVDKIGKPIKIDFIRTCWQQMLEAVYTTHSEKIVHSDLKPANFIVTEGSLKLIDFGIARTIQNDTTNIHREQQDLNAANNQSGGEKLIKLGRASDVWSLGCILYQLVYGRTPFAHLNMYQKFKCIPDPDYHIEFPSTSSPIYNGNQAPLTDENGASQEIPVDENLLRIMKSCIQRNPKDRATIPELLSDPFLSGSYVRVSEQILNNLIREIIKYTKKANINDSQEQITMIAKSVFSQLRNKELISCEQWGNK
ncbi:15937_t:CDS:10 [Dentiscutata erythropus]|uniref:15937_t:CDS:1 n=1 Tax=Dentiscutata erythropus TaxID=1348616 RepID=A0A9N9BZN1_9GLOM|nr:15937_t:CDS:10 [Dentiscutata erythropus]